MSYFPGIGNDRSPPVSAETGLTGYANIADFAKYQYYRRMKFAERILYASAGAHFAAAFVGQSFEWKTIYYWSTIIGAVAVIVLSAGWFRHRDKVTEVS